jgi:NAD(P)-dependent dehydrogenase (short-subunit alcohol dehydrogenase family)
MDYRIQGKCVFINAGAHGIGEATADLLTQEGASVIVADKDSTALEEKGHRWAGVVVADLATADGIESAMAQVFATFGRAPDILVNNLGVGNSASFEALSDEDWTKCFEVNFLGCVRSCRAMIPRMSELGDASVVNMGSDIAKQPEPTMIDYGACKAALLYLTKALAVQYAPRVRVNAVLPGPIWTNMWTRPGGIVDQLVESYGVDKDLAVKRFLQDRYMPLGIGDPEDVAHAVAFLASPIAKFITGATLDIGGTLRGLI